MEREKEGLDMRCEIWDVRKEIGEIKILLYL